MKRDPAQVVVRPSAARAAAADWRAVLQQAMQAHQADDLETAERLYREVLELRVAQPDALHYLGVLCHQRGRSDEGAELIRTALQVTPKHPDAHNNLGNIHKECNRLREAEACYRKALEYGPQHHNALSNLAVVLEAQQRPQEAFEAFEKLLKLAPRFAQGYYLLGLFLRNNAQNIEHIEQSVGCFREAYALEPRFVQALEALSVSLYTLGRKDEAQQAYRDWLEREPDNPVPRHMLAASGGAEAPLRAGDDYVRDTFDGFAESFDEQLLKNLDYRAPEVLAAALAAVLPAPTASLDILDAGCGTGLCAPLLRPHARRLAGVDLSGGMVKKARLRGGYDVLDVAELTAYLQRQQQAWDVVLSADTLVYFGELGTVLAAAHGALRPGGWVVFSLEVDERADDCATLSASGRYRHSRSHVSHALARAGFGDIRIGEDSLRKEFGLPVRSWVVLAQRGD